MRNEPEPVIGAIEAFRWFQVSGDRLLSIGAGDYLWTPGANTARCHLAGQKRTKTVWVNDPDDPENIVKRKERRAWAHGRIPALGCTCGFWVMRDEPSAESPGGSVLARVLIWGRAIQHRDGYRAEHAAIVALITEHPKRFTSVMDAYSIPSARPRTRAEQGFTTAYLTTVDGDRVKLDVPTRETNEVIGWFTVAPGVDVPEPVAHLTARFTPERVITEIRVHHEHDEEER